MGSKKDKNGPRFSGISDGFCPKCHAIKLEEIRKLKAKTMAQRVVTVESMKLNGAIVGCFSVAMILCGYYWYSVSAILG